MIKRIGIATQYTNSCNYGGVLQAYALCKKLNSMGFITKQINYIDSSEPFKSKLKRSLRNGRLILVVKNRVVTFVNKFIGELYHSQNEINMRSQAFRLFRDAIPHTEIIYSADSIVECNEFDIYITGSDQVWRIGEANRLCDFYWLNFLHTDKVKISYAASISTNGIPEKLHSKIKTILLDYKAISVREYQDKQIVDDILGCEKAHWVLDPTFLLTRDEWDELCEANPYKNKSYLFVYLLGSNKKQRRFITNWARKNNKVIISIPYLLGQFRNCDRTFGDIRRSDVTPNLWLSLIRDADCVFTDSFHATVFSSIFHTPFYVFKRNKDTERTSMNSRIYSLTELLECENRIIEDDADINNIPALDDIDFVQADKNVAIKREESISFLKDSLEG